MVRAYETRVASPRSCVMRDMLALTRPQRGELTHLGRGCPMLGVLQRGCSVPNPPVSEGWERCPRVRPEGHVLLVVPANAYWLTGRGPDIVGELASRAKAADPENRAAWHLWALAESEVRARVERWKAVSARFPQDQLARAALADNAASLAGAEHD